MSEHPIVHVELSAQDLAASASFYNEVFGWRVQAVPEFNYYTFETGPNAGGGFNKIDGDSTKAGDVIVYIETSDIEASLREIEARGGQTMTPKTEIAGVGWFGLFRDPAGNRVGLFTALPPAGAS